MALRLRRGSDAERQLVTPLQGELIYATDTKKIYVGDGATLGGVLVGPTEADAFTSVVGDTNPQLGGDLDLNSNNITGVGNINIDGTINATGNIGLGDNDSDVINVSGVINSNLKPALDGQFNLGTNNRRWNNLWAEGAVISGELTTESLTVTNNITTVGSSVLYNASNDTIQAASIVGNLTGNLYADDSTVVVDANQKKFTGEVEGNILSPGLSTFTGGMNITTANIDGGTMDGVAIGQDGVTPVANIKGREVRAQNGFFGNVTGDTTGYHIGDVFGSIKGSVFGGDSSIIIDDSTSTVLGNVNNSTTTSKQVNSATINLSGRDDANLPAAVLITTTDTYADGAQFSALGHSDTVDGLGMQLARFRGTEGSPAGLQVGDEIGTMLFIGGDSAGTATPAAAFKVEVNDTPVAGNVKAGFWIATQNAAAGNALTPALELTSSQGANFYGPAKLYSFADTTARDAAIATPAAGMMIYLTATNKAQVYNGTAWTDLH